MGTYGSIGAAAVWTNVDTAMESIGDAVDSLYARMPQKTGTVYYVSSVDGDDDNDGLTWETPFALIQTAIDACTANNNDVVVVLPKHVETIITKAIEVDIAGVSIVGVGRGSLMPQIVHNLAAGEVSIAADNVTWQGIRHTAHVTDVLIGIEIEDGIDYCTVRGCKFDVDTAGTDEFAVCVRTNDASNYALVEDCFMDMGLGNAVAGVSFTEDTIGSIVRGCTIKGDYSTANIEGITTLSLKLLMENNLLINGEELALGTKPCIQLLTGTTGIIRDNDCVTNLATMLAAIAADSVFLFRNYYNEDITGTGTIFGTASADD